MEETENSTLFTIRSNNVLTKISVLFNLITSFLSAEQVFNQLNNEADELITSSYFSWLKYSYLDIMVAKPNYADPL